MKSNDNDTPLAQAAGITQARAAAGQPSPSMAMRVKKDAVIQSILTRRGVTEYEAHKLQAARYPDGSEHYTYEGKPLVKFLTPLVEAKTDDGSFTIITKVEHQELAHE